MLKLSLVFLLILGVNVYCRVLPLQKRLVGHYWCMRCPMCGVFPCYSREFACNCEDCSCFRKHYDGKLFFMRNTIMSRQWVHASSLLLYRFTKFLGSSCGRGDSIMDSHTSPHVPGSRRYFLPSFRLTSTITVSHRWAFAGVCGRSGKVFSSFSGLT